MSELNTRLEWLADYIVNNNHNYVGGEFEREDTNESFIVVVAKDSAWRNLTEENAKLREALQECVEALDGSYDVTEWPANGQSRCDIASSKAKLLLIGD